jgi:hypothetical protein
VNLAELARPAVGAFALAALAVSATLALRRSVEERVVEVRDLSNTAFESCVRVEPMWRARIGPVAVVGSPNYEAIVARIMPLEPALSQCAFATTRVSIYMHVANHEWSNLTVLGGNAEIAACVRGVIDRLALGIEDDADLMIPVELVR